MCKGTRPPLVQNKQNKDPSEAAPERATRPRGHPPPPARPRCSRRPRLGPQLDSPKSTRVASLASPSCTTAREGVGQGGGWQGWGWPTCGRPTARAVTGSRARQVSSFGKLQRRVSGGIVQPPLPVLVFACETESWDVSPTEAEDPDALSAPEEGAGPSASEPVVALGPPGGACGLYKRLNQSRKPGSPRKGLPSLDQPTPGALL